MKENTSRIKVYGKFKKGKTLTTQVVRESIFKEKKGFIKGSNNQNYQRDGKKY